MAGNGKRVLLAGATGLVGGLCLSRLLADDSFEAVISVGRRPLSPSPSDPRFKEVSVDFFDLGSRSPDLVADTVICALGSTMKKAGSRDAFYQVDYTHCLNLAKICRQNGASRFILVSALGANPKAFSFYSRVKGRLEEAIGDLSYDSLTILRPSLIMGKRGEFRPFEEIAKLFTPMLSFLIPDKFKPIEAETVAAALWISARLEKPGVNILESNEIRKLYEDVTGKGR